MESPLLDPAFGYLIVLGIALLFAVAGSHKLRSLSRFTEVFAAYGVLPEGGARRTAWLIACVELATAAGLLWETSRGWALIAALVLLVAYASAMAFNLARGRRELDCGCGAAGQRRSIAAWMVWRNGVLALLVGIAALPWSPRTLDAADLLTIGGGLAASLMLYLAIDRLEGEVAPQAMSLGRRPS